METCKIDRPILSDSSDDPVFNTIENFSKLVFLKSSKRETSLAKWLSVRLRTKSFWVRVQLQSEKPL